MAVTATGMGVPAVTVAATSSSVSAGPAVSGTTTAKPWYDAGASAGLLPWLAAADPSIASR